jgi:hypothetical protein
MYLNVKHTLKGPVDIATKFDYWYEIAFLMFPNALWEYYMSIEKIGTSEY